LESLKSDAAGEQAALITEKAEAALRLQSRGQALVVPPQPQDLTTNITVYPRDRSLPNSFARQDWSKMPIEQWLLPQCLKEKRKTCEAFVIDLDADGIDEILLIEPAGRPATVFKVRNDLWYVAGTMSFQITCRDSLEALRAGRFKLIPSGWKELEIEGKGVHFLRKPEFGQEKCSD